jgi:hypothetical protein
MDGSGVASSADQILILINTLAAFSCRQYVRARIHKRTIVQVKLFRGGHKKTAADSRDGASRTELSNNVDRA